MLMPNPALQHFAGAPGEACDDLFQSVTCPGRDVANSLRLRWHRKMQSYRAIGFSSGATLAKSPSLRSGVTRRMCASNG